MLRKIKQIVFALCMTLFFVTMTVQAAETDELVILYTNDVHTYIDGDITYSKLASLKKLYKNVLLLDAGDHTQGTAYGSMDQGETIVNLMNLTGYDAATLGNHEFDYGMNGCLQTIDRAEYAYLSCNFYHEENGVFTHTVLDSCKVFDIAGKKIAVIGITTPESIKSSTPAYFQDENGKYIYGIAAGNDGASLYASVQTAIDAVSEEADVIIALGHLGDDATSAPWRSEDVIKNTTGLDAFIDGHSHSTVPMKSVEDKNGNTVILSQTGEYFHAVGKMTISDDGIKTELLTKDDLSGITADPTVKPVEDAWIQELEEKLGETIGSLEVVLDNYDSDNNRLVRSQETNSGDFSADALYYLFDQMDMDVDVAIMNGGGIRNKALTGDISYKNCKEIHTFGNVACLQTVTGQQIMDALEWGARSAGVSEEGCFLQVSGLTYKIDTSIESTVQADENGVWTGGPTGKYRVHDVKVYNKKTGTWDALNLSGKYNLAGYNYILRNLGDGFAMFDGAVNVLDYVMEDYLILANYVKGFEDCKVKADNSPLSKKYTGFNIAYGTVNGSGRIIREKQIEAYPIWVSGIQLTEINTSGDGWSYDRETKTLTLDNYAYSGAGYKNAAIYAEEDVHIVLKGENKIQCTGYYGICIKKATLSIMGKGSLEVAGSDYGIYTSGWNIGALTIGKEVLLFASSGDVASGSSYGIRADGAFVIQDQADVTAVGGYAPVRSCGIYAYTTLTIGDSAKVSATGGGSSDTTGDETDSYGIRTTDMFVNGGTLTTEGGTAKYASCGIFTQTLTVSDGEIIAKGGTALSGPSIGIQAVKTLNVSGGQLEATGGNASASADTSCGILVNGDTTISDGVVTATGTLGGYTRGIQTNTFSVSGGTVTGEVEKQEGITANYSCGIQSSGMAAITGGNVYADGGNAESSYGFVTAADFTIKNGNLYVTAGDAVSESCASSVGLTVYGNLTVCDGVVTASAGTAAGESTICRGLAVVGGALDAQSEQITFSTKGTPGLLGTKISVTGETYVELGITIDEKLKQTSEDDQLTIEPLLYTVHVRGLETKSAVDVPAGCSVNEIYCDYFKIEDFGAALLKDKEGYTFGGWFTDETYTKSFTFDDKVTADITVYAKWIPNEEQGSGSDSSQITPTPSDKADNSGNSDKTNTSVSTNSPKTEDESNWILWVLLVGVSFAVMAERNTKKKRCG